MTKKRGRKGPPPIVYISIVLILAGIGFWYWNLPKPLSPGTQVRIDGSTSMVIINQNLKSGFEQKYPGTTAIVKANGSDKGLEDLKAGKADIAAVSRPLEPEEKKQGLVEVPIARDEIAVVVGRANSFQGGLTTAQLTDIFQGKSDNWSAVGGSTATIRVINRPSFSGTHHAFKELVLKGQDFGSTPNFTTLPRDETTALLRELKTDGIGYATADQVLTQETVRVVPIDGVKPKQANYPLSRMLYYVYKDPPSQAAKAFVEYAKSEY